MTPERLDAMERPGAVIFEQDIRDLLAEVRALQQDNDRLLADRDRLDWIEADRLHWLSGWHTEAGWTVHLGRNVVLAGSQNLRTAIDAARSA
jgi:hypothetical protein